MKRDALISGIATVIIGLQAWILIEVVTMRERMARVETQLMFIQR